MRIEAELNVTVPELDLSSVVERHGDHVTVADLIAEKAIRELAQGHSWKPLTERIRAIEDEEIRAAVRELITEALNGPIRKTNTYGESYGEPTTLRALIGEEVTKAVGKSGGSYERSESVLNKVIREEVTSAFRKELADVIKDQKAKVIDAVRAEAADVLAEAIEKGLNKSRL